MASSVSTLSSSGGASSPLQITGLASGLDTNSIIQELMSIAQQPVTNLQHQQNGLRALNTNLSAIQSSLQSLSANAQALSSATLFANTQTVSSTNSTVVGASATSSVGAVVGGYQVAVTQLATAAQQTFTFNPSTTDTVKITNGSGTEGDYTVTSTTTAQDLVNEVNSDTSGSVWATLTDSTHIVFSSRTTGDQSTFTVASAGGALTNPSTFTTGKNAQLTVNGTAVPDSQSNTVTNAIAGVTLTLGGITAPGQPVTVNVGAPSVSTTAVQNAVQTFVNSYNSVLDQINAQLSQAPSRSDPTQGTLFGDSDLSDLLSTMRQAMYTPGQGLPQGLASMLDIGVSTGASTGGGTLNQNAISGHLTVDTAALTKAIQSNPAGVTAVLKSWSTNFTNAVNSVAQTGGTIDSRIQSDDSQVTQLGEQISTLQSALADRQTQLQTQFAALEAALSQNQSQASWLASQLNALPTPKG